MNSTFFACKRAHHSCLRMSRRLLARAITPARFDMLHILDILDPHRFGFFQRELCTLLGVTAPVVSRMLTSLEKLGLIQRERDWEEDRRRRIITITDEGRALFRGLVAEIGQMDELLVDAALCPERFWSDAETWTERAQRERRSSFRHHHRNLLRTFEDGATFDFDRPSRYFARLAQVAA